MWELTFSKIPDSFSSRSDFFYTLKCEEPQNPETLIWGSTRIDENTGIAAKGSLHFIEYIPAGTEFSAQLEAPSAHIEILHKIIRCTTHLGHGRNRGSGRIQTKLVEQATTVKFSHIKSNSFPLTVRLLLENLEPLCLAKTGHPGNIIPTEPYIRGRMLRGAFAGLSLANKNSELAQNLHEAGILWSDALPLPQLKKPVEQVELASLEVKPIPLSIKTPKAKAEKSLLPWWAVNGSEKTYLGDRQEIEELSTKDKPAEKLKRPSAGEFVFRDDKKSQWHRYKPQMQQRLRTAVPKHGEEQSLFSNEELAEKTCFVADLIITNSQALASLNQVLELANNNWLRLGRGGKPVALLKHHAWSDKVKTGKNKQFTLLLESDLIMRDEFLRYQTSLTPKLLADWLNLDNKEFNFDVRNHQVSDHHAVYGFNATTGLPRANQVAIAAGSILHVQGSGAASMFKALLQLQAIGELTEEGFGRFSINSVPKPEEITKNTKQLTKHKAQRQVSNSVNQPKIDTEPNLCEQAKELAASLEFLTKVSRTQLGELRDKSQAARNLNDIQEIFKNLETAATKLGGTQWKAITEHNEYAHFKNKIIATANQSLNQAQVLFDYFIRWCRIPVLFMRALKVTHFRQLDDPLTVFGLEGTIFGSVFTLSA